MGKVVTNRNKTLQYYVLNLEGYKVRWLRPIQERREANRFRWLTSAPSSSIHPLLTPTAIPALPNTEIDLIPSYSFRSSNPE